MGKEAWKDLEKELQRLYDLHERSAADPGKCRTFNSQVSLLLERLEEMQAWDLADRVMDLLAGCSPKDFTPCDNRQCTKGSLERLQEKIRAKMD
ncbi:MAG TPA: hypothetical protein PLN19_08390 [Methanothrix sp.]|nr:hypothetical protein [Methanothrix sp.]HPC90550.1 hypothetical protein [Methanothrix sp.]HQE88271.1 hypothetical protein [Methanothrix sp.]HQI69048.1 hypothetical protein [Methanothrix sp.]HRS85810.1 hypothetical protein [Methanothrix sp.]